MASDLARLLGINIRAFRKRLGVTQEKLAGEVKMSTPYMNLIESGKKFPSEEKILKLAHVLNVRPFELFLDPMVDSPSSEATSKAVAEDFLSELAQEVERFTKDYQARHRG